MAGLEEFELGGAIATEEGFNGGPVDAEEEGGVSLPLQEFANGKLGSWARVGGGDGEIHVAGGR